MSKVKYTFRVDEEILKQMKIRAVQQGIALNELLVKCWQNYMVNNDIKVDKCEEPPFIIKE